VLDTRVLQPVTKISTTVRVSVSNKCRDSSDSTVTRLRAGEQEFGVPYSAGRDNVLTIPGCAAFLRNGVERSMRDAGHSSVSTAECNN